MGFLCLVIVVIMWGIFKDFKLRVKEFMRIFRMDITMKANGKRICNTAKEHKNIQTKMSTRVHSCAAANLAKESTNSQMVESIKDHFTTDTAMDMES